MKYILVSMVIVYYSDAITMSEQTRYFDSMAQCELIRSNWIKSVEDLKLQARSRTKIDFDAFCTALK